MRSVEIMTWCDLCSETEGKKVPATISLIFGTSYEDPADRVLDVCEEHGATTSIADLLQDMGREYVPPNRDKPPRKVRPYELKKREEMAATRPSMACPFCGQFYEIGRGIAIHVKYIHPEHFKLKVDWSHVSYDGKKMKTA